MDTPSQIAVREQDPFSMMERMDEQQVLDEIKGKAIDALVYEIKEGGKSVTGLSLSGVREVARSMNKSGNARIGISDREPVIIETEDYFEVKTYAVDVQNGGGYWGIKRQPKSYSDGRINKYALEQALAKAQRNALRGLIPEYFAKEMIAAFRNRGNVKVIEGQTAKSSTHSSAEPVPSRLGAPAPTPAVVIDAHPELTDDQMIAKWIREAAVKVPSGNAEPTPNELQRIGSVINGVFQTTPDKTRSVYRHAIYTQAVGHEVKSAKDLNHGLVQAMLSRWERPDETYHPNDAANGECQVLLQAYHIAHGQSEMGLPETSPTTKGE